MPKICMGVLTVSIVLKYYRLLIKVSKVIKFSVGKDEPYLSLLITLGRHFSCVESLSSYEVSCHVHTSHD